MFPTLIRQVYLASNPPLKAFLMNIISRGEALALLAGTKASDSLMRHALATEAVMGALANRLGANATLWSITGLLHDLDYPQTESDPARHGLAAAELLAESLPDEALCAIRAHNGEMNGHPPATIFDYALRCGETVTGLIAAAALMRPTRYDGMTVKSIKKKLKDKAFAANVNRENIKQCRETGLELDEFLELAICAMAASDAETGGPTCA